MSQAADFFTGFEEVDQGFVLYRAAASQQFELRVSFAKGAAGVPQIAELLTSWAAITLGDV
jgi:hypothetical protein